MKKVFSLNLLILSLFISILSLKAEAQKFEIQDSTNNSRKTAETISSLEAYDSRWITIAVQNDFVNSTYGLHISNGFDERPLKHFEDFQDIVVFKLSAQTNFKEDYSLGANLGWQYPIRHLSQVSTEFRQFDYWQSEFFCRDINLSTKTHWKSLGIILKIGHQKLNDQSNIGPTIELQRDIIYNKLYSGVSVGYYSDYCNYSAFLQGFIYKNIISLRFVYERIDRYDLLNLGVNFTFKR